MLKKHFKIIHASDPKASLEMLEREDFDIVLADMAKPLFLGLKVIEHMRSLKICKPVCLIASKEDRIHPHGKENMTHAIELGAAGYFERPVSPHFICHRLKCIMESFSTTNDIYNELMANRSTNITQSKRDRKQMILRLNQSAIEIKKHQDNVLGKNCISVAAPYRKKRPEPRSPRTSAGISKSKFDATKQYSKLMNLHTFSQNVSTKYATEHMLVKQIGNATVQLLEHKQKSETKIPSPPHGKSKGSPSMTWSLFAI